MLPVYFLSHPASLAENPVGITGAFAIIQTGLKTADRCDVIMDNPRLWARRLFTRETNIVSCVILNRWNMWCMCMLRGERVCEEERC